MSKLVYDKDGLQKEIAFMEDIKFCELRQLIGSKYQDTCIRITGYIMTDDSATTGLTDINAIKEWAYMISKQYNACVMFDIIFRADGQYRISGYMYNGGSYGCLFMVSFGICKIINRISDVWYEKSLN